MPWLVVSPSHEWPWYWHCRINRHLSFARKYFNYLLHLSVGKSKWKDIYDSSDRLRKLTVNWLTDIFVFCGGEYGSYVCMEVMWHYHYIDVIMTTMAFQITSLTVAYSTVYSDADQRKHQSSASLAFVLRIHRDRWIPRTKGQLRGKCFHLMTSSCHSNFITTDLKGCNV